MTSIEAEQSQFPNPEVEAIRWWGGGGGGRREVGGPPDGAGECPWARGFTSGGGGGGGHGPGGSPLDSVSTSSSKYCPRTSSLMVLAKFVV